MSGSSFTHRSRLPSDAAGAQAMQVQPPQVESPAARGNRNGFGSDDLGQGRPRRRRIPPKLYRIGEVVVYSGMSRQTIHNYTTMGLLKEMQWSSGGHRLYDQTVFTRLDKIAQMRARHKSLEAIRDHFLRLDSD